MDYSLLVGVHFRGKGAYLLLKVRQNSNADLVISLVEGAIDIDGDKPATPRLSRWDRDHFLSDPNR